MTQLVDHLMRLGLSEYEARAYIATVALGEGTVKEISVESGVPRSRTYDVMEHLAERGFVQVGNSNPICYRANSPLVSSNHIMEEMRRASDEIVHELGEIGRRAEKAENPIWTLRGGWAIDHKITELLSSAKVGIVLICINNSHMIRYAKLLTERSQELPITAVLTHDPESFAGWLGDTKVRRINKSPPHITKLNGELHENGFVTKDGRYCLELILLIDEETTLALSKENGTSRAIVINGTIMSLFAMETINTVLENSDEVVCNGRPSGRPPTSAPKNIKLVRS
ncbi:MAG: helix-turn-helix domain-containing protein [Methanomassiliicoccus sp.]|nr:helix-turn-helix domain-containing protein [Methanomassiliicoccus sp.]